MSVKTPKPKDINIVSVKRTRKTIRIQWMQGDSKFELDERDNPLPAFIKAMDKLAEVAGAICHFTPAYSDTGLRVTGFSMSEQGGAKTVSLMARKDIDDASKQFVFTTPDRLMAHPSEPGSYTPPLTNSHVALVEEAIEQAKLYVCDERAQGIIKFDDEEEEALTPEEAGDELAFDAALAKASHEDKGSKGKPAKKKKSKAKK